MIGLISCSVWVGCGSEEVRKFSWVGNCLKLFTHNSQDDNHLKSAFPLFRAINLGYFLEILESWFIQKVGRTLHNFPCKKYNTYPPNHIPYPGVWKGTHILLTEQLPCPCHILDCKLEIEFIVFQRPVPTRRSWHSQSAMHDSIHKN